MKFHKSPDCTNICRFLIACGKLSSVYSGFDFFFFRLEIKMEVAGDFQ